MVIKDEYKSFTELVSQINDSVKEKRELRSQMEHILAGALVALEVKKRNIFKKIDSLKDLGIFYCKKCNDLYEVSDTIIEKTEGDIAVGLEWEDNERARTVYQRGIEFRYYCPQCDGYITKKFSPK